MKLLFKPLSLAMSALGGVLAGLVFKKVWQLVAHEDEAPEASDTERNLSEVLIAATLQGAIFAAVQAIINRSNTKAVERLTK